MQNGGEENIKTIEQEQSNFSIKQHEESFKSQDKVVETEFSDFEETSDYNDDTANNSELESIPIDDSYSADEDISFSIVFGDFDCFEDFDQLRYDRYVYCHQKDVLYNVIKNVSMTFEIIEDHMRSLFYLKITFVLCFSLSHYIEGEG